jgi:hypothetical protein
MDELSKYCLYMFLQCLFCAKIDDCDLDLDLHAIWQECSGISTPPSCLAIDLDPRHIISDENEPVEYET